MKTPGTPKWLQTAVFYEIYPQSFYDSNADGIGDLAGILAKLDYIKSLGCNAIWLNPCFDSPFGDAGYDVRDFFKVAPRYGTNADLKKLTKEAAKRGIRVVLDLVAGHTSSEHPWFKASCSHKPNKYSNWYIWTQDVWTAAGEGFSAVNGHAERDGNYIANFFYFQPALNYGFAKPDPKKPWQLPVDHPEVQEVHAELRKIMKFWLDHGVIGFRVDMAFSLIRNDPGHKATISFWQGIRKWIKAQNPDAVLISEWSHPSRAIASGFDIDFLIHMKWDLPLAPYTALFRNHLKEFNLEGGPSVFQKEGKGNMKQVLDVYIGEYLRTRGRGYISIPTGNHDLARIRKTRDLDELKVAYAFMFMMPGVPFIYYGDEIGLRHLDGLPSKEGAYSRTGARTPMQWDTTRNAGFSTAKSSELYLPIDPATDRPAVAAQSTDPNSLLNFVRDLISLRQSHPALQADGKFVPVFARNKHSAFAFIRSLGREAYLVAVNPSDHPTTIPLRRNLVGTLGQQIFGAETSIRSDTFKFSIELPPVSFGIFSVIGRKTQKRRQNSPSAKVPSRARKH